MSQSPISYESWTREDLIARLVDLDRPPKPAIQGSSTPAKKFHLSSHARRKIAIKFCYSGWEYNGLAFQSGPTPMPTVEEVLFDAFSRTRLIDPETGPEGCGWERCGRTDRGVSAAGQVVSLWVRSALGGESDPSVKPDTENEDTEREGETVNVSAHEELTELSEDTPGLDGELGLMDDLVEPSSLPKAPPSAPTSELKYVSILNRILPPTIRVLAWSPVSPNFSARFATRYRHYKYFFSPYGLDVNLMRDGCARLLGGHDFRNLCKLDPAKQITNFKRRILRSEISSISGSPGTDDNHLHVFDLVGTAFLYHQVRHIMAVLFLIGTGLEHPSVMTALLNVDPSNPEPGMPDDPPLKVVDRKPEYQMADGLPLMLWDCAYDESDVRWRTDKEEDETTHAHESSRSGSGGELYHQLHSIHARGLIHTALESHFLSAAEQYHPRQASVLPLSPAGLEKSGDPSVLKVPLGGGTYHRTSKYIPLLSRKRLDNVELINERYRLGKGERKNEKKRAAVEEKLG